VTRKTPSVRLFACAAFVAFIAVSFTGCDYGRMYDQDSVKTYERKATPMDKRAVPTTDGINALNTVDPRNLRNPLSFSKETVEQGKLAYGYFCVQCHGPKLDGHGLVGQSFSPLPADLRSSVIMSQGDGVIYVRIRLGFKRHPPLFSTVSDHDAWSVIVYLRSVQGPS
jgi:hypothetical protein